MSILFLAWVTLDQTPYRPELLAGDQAQRAITNETSDPFFSQLSQVDIEARLGQSVDGFSKEQATESLRQLFRNSVINWPEREQSALIAACGLVKESADRLCPGLIPPRWRFVLTDGSEEGGAAYTRGNTIILPIQKLRTDLVLGQIAKLVAHETCHVYGRQHPQTREKLLARLGFRVVSSIALGPAIESRKLTNPDSPVIDSIIQVQPTPGVDVPVTLVLYADPGRFSPVKGQGVFKYLKYGLVAVADLGEGRFGVVGGQDQLPVVYSPNDVAGFYEKVGHNTRYILSPDEILADNIAIALVGSGGVPLADPRLPADLAEIIRNSTEASPAED
jgi:hypothetical protein